MEEDFLQARCQGLTGYEWLIWKETVVMEIGTYRYENHWQLEEPFVFTIGHWPMFQQIKIVDISPESHCTKPEPMSVDFEGHLKAITG